MNLGVLFWAELRREFILLFRYPFELVSRLVWNLGFALLVFYGFKADVMASGGSLPGFENNQLGQLLGLLITFIAINGLSNATELLGSEVQTGTLEQAALSPPPLVLIVLMRDLASYIEMLVRFVVVLAIAIAITHAHFHLNVPGFLVTLTLMYAGMEGIGLALGGAGLLYKRVQTLAQFTVMLVFGLALMPLQAMPGWMGWFVNGFPFTKALLVLRAIAIQGVPLAKVAADGSLLSLAVNSLAFLAIGVAVFAWAERTARDWGTLNQY